MFQGSDLDLASQLYDAVGRQPEILHRALAALEHPGEQALAPQSHARATRRDQLLAAQEETRAHRPDRLAAKFDPHQVARHVNMLREAVVQDEAEEALAER